MQAYVWTGFIEIHCFWSKEVIAIIRSVILGMCNSHQVKYTQVFINMHLFTEGEINAAFWSMQVWYKYRENYVAGWAYHYQSIWGVPLLGLEYKVLWIIVGDFLNFPTIQA